MNLKEIHAFEVDKYLTTHFGSFRIFPLLAGGVARRDVIIYKVDRHSELLGQFRESDLGCNTQYSMMT